MSTLQAIGIGKTYDVPVLNEIHLAVEAGQILAICGKSGSGKTTLIKILAGLLDPDQGQVFFNGKRLEGPADKLVPGHQEIRLVHQDFNLYHRMTVEENIRNSLLEYTEEYRQLRTAELLKLCGISHVEDQFVHEISGGEKQRVAIAMALSTEPRVLLFDEPFSNLDLNTKGVLLQEIESIARDTDTAVILVTHDSRDAMEIADEMIILEKGSLIRKGDPRTVYHRPQHREVADLLGVYTLLSREEANQIIPGFVPEDDVTQYGIWAEDVHLNQETQRTATVEKCIFSGSHFKVLLKPESGISLWAYAPYEESRGSQVCFSINEGAVFPLKSL